MSEEKDCIDDMCLEKETSSRGFVYKEDEKEFLKVKEDDLSWKPCIKCGGELTQERKAFFVCVNCKQEYIADEEDMKK